jgi:DNA-binding NarL/FixJ family response regulator
MLRLAQHRAASNLEGLLARPAEGGLTDQALCWRALELTVCGNQVEARRLARTLLKQSPIIAVQNVARFATAITLSQSHATGAEDALRETARECVRVGDVLTVVCAYRAWPDMLPHLLADEIVGSAIAELLLTFDRRLASSVGLERSEPRERQETGSEALSRRESEVLGLLTEGLTNREIAERLFIAESTAKLHVRRICAKLGVRSRTEAALRAIH